MTRTSRYLFVLGIILHTFLVNSAYRKSIGSNATAVVLTNVKYCVRRKLNFLQMVLVQLLCCANHTVDFVYSRYKDFVYLPNSKIGRTPTFVTSDNDPVHVLAHFPAATVRRLKTTMQKCHAFTEPTLLALVPEFRFL